MFEWRAQIYLTREGIYSRFANLPCDKPRSYHKNRNSPDSFLKIKIWLTRTEQVTHLRQQKPIDPSTGLEGSYG